jgi:hypothetical protein
MVKVGFFPEDVTMPPSEVPVLKDDYVFITMRHDKFLISICLAVDGKLAASGSTATIGLLIHTELVLSVNRSSRRLQDDVFGMTFRDPAASERRDLARSHGDTALVTVSS